MLSMINDFFKKKPQGEFSNNIQNAHTEMLRKLYLKADVGIPMPPREACNTDAETFKGNYTIGYSYNLLNNAYIFSKIARANGIDAKLFLETNFADIMITSLPYWEEEWKTAKKMPPHDSKEVAKWSTPDFVKDSSWNLDIYDTLNINFDYPAIKKLLKGSAVTPPEDEYSYLEAYSVLGHLALLKLYNEVDILHVSGTHIGVASFTNKPYVTFPFGDDLYDIPFRNSELGWMQVRGFRKAKRHIISGECMLDYCDSLHIDKSKIDLLPFMINTDDYAPLGDANRVRDELRKKHPGKTIFLVGARQNWYWKGSNKLLGAISKIRKKYGNSAVFLLAWYGQDLDKSEKLIKELGISENIVKLGIMSKQTLKHYIDAVDVCIDQFTLGGVGTFALESLSLATPLITYYRRDRHFKFDEDPPLLNAFSENDIFEKLSYCIDNNNKLPDLGNDLRKWLVKHHGHKTLWPAYDECYRKALV